jgi:regulator of cell morphogenesis and NO signaling
MFGGYGKCLICFSFGKLNAEAMITSDPNYIEALHLDPIASLALKRYVSVSEEKEFIDRATGKVENQDFVLDLVRLYADQTLDLSVFEKYQLSEVMDYLNRTHGLYTNRMLPKIEMAIANVTRHFPDHPISAILEHFFHRYRNELLEHIELEESKLFPYANELAQGHRRSDYSISTFMLQHDHSIESDLVKIIPLVEKEYPEVAQSFSFRAFRTLLAQLGVDLKIHHLIEERVFLSKVLQLEKGQ